MGLPLISIVIPVHNEQEVLPELFKRLMTVMPSLELPYEMIFTNDGSTDDSGTLLKAFQVEYPNEVRVIHFNGNFGQHMAIMAGFERVRGQFIITLDADLQNPPEEIPNIVKAMQAGHDVVGCYRVGRQDKAWRLCVSRWHNQIREKMMPKIRMRDEGCMLRGYHRTIVEAMIVSQEASTYIPALAMTYATNPTELPVEHAARLAGVSSYDFYSLVRYNFDLITGFSLVPLQLMTFVGIFISMASVLFVVYLAVRRLWVGPEAEGVFTLFAILFFLIGVVLMAIGVMGEYVGRIYQEVRKRPRFIIREENDALSIKNNSGK